MKCEKCQAQLEPYRTLASNSSFQDEYIKSLQEDYASDVCRLEREIKILKDKHSIASVLTSAIKYVFYNIICNVELLPVLIVIFSCIFVFIIVIKLLCFPGQIQYCYITGSNQKYNLNAHYDYAFDATIRSSDDENHLKEIAKEYNCELKLR